MILKLQQTLSEAEHDVENGNIAPIQDTMEELKKLLLMRNKEN